LEAVVIYTAVTGRLPKKTIGKSISKAI